jgi:murein DD-endopeptidase MepM/ murein hydrolase activator NlpD
MTNSPLRFISQFLVAVIWLFSMPLQGADSILAPLADGFDAPVGKPSGVGYYKARGLRLRPPYHFGEDWNGVGGGDSDLGAPVYACADGIIVFSYDVRGGWGNVIIIRHAYRDPATRTVKFVDSLYGHLDKRMGRMGQEVKRGQQVGTIGNNYGMYPAHLHFEIRHDITIGMHRESVACTLDHWAVPTDFINKNRRLNKEFTKQAMPIGTFKPYGEFKGL